MDRRASSEQTSRRSAGLLVLFFIAFFTAIAGVGFCWLSVWTGCATTWQQTVSRDILAAHSAAAELHVQVKKKYDAQCMVNAEQCAAGKLHKCLELQACQARRKSAYDAVKALSQASASCADIMKEFP